MFGIEITLLDLTFIEGNFSIAILRCYNYNNGNFRALLNLEFGNNNTIGFNILWLNKRIWIIKIKK